MAEIYHKKSGKLCDTGKTQIELLNLVWYKRKPDDFAISDTGQLFDAWQTRISNNENWHFVENLNLYFISKRDSHGWISACKTIFTTERWEEIDHILEDDLIVKLLWKGDLARLKKKIQRARSAGRLTTADVQTLVTIFGNGDV